MLSKIVGGTSLLLNSISLIDMATGCKNVEMMSIANQNSLTDYLSDHDEITLQFGVGELIRFQYSNFFEEDEIIEVPKAAATPEQPDPIAKIQFPCFDNEVVGFYILEHDEYEDDTSSAVALNCEVLQEGTNEVLVNVKQQNAFLSKVYDAFKGSTLTEFKFFDDALNDAATYSIKFDVKNKCSHEPLINEDLEMPGKLQWRSVPRNLIDNRIDQEDFDDKPGIVLPGGEVVTKTTTGITEEDLKAM